MATANTVMSSSIRRFQRNSPLQCSYPAIPDSVPVARAAVVAVAAEAGVAPEVLDDIRLAVSEALTNVVVHAYREAREPGLLEVTAVRAGSEFWVLVSDAGCGLRPRDDSPGLGLGMALMVQLTEGMDVTERSLGGTEVALRFPLRGDPASASHHSRGSCDSASSPASPRFSTTR
jgi:anti-sigma regulatory factor (Ser/Thr protein kinase)